MMMVRSKAVARCPCGAEALLELRQTFQIDPMGFDRSVGGVGVVGGTDSVTLPCYQSETTPAVVWPIAWFHAGTTREPASIRCPNCDQDIRDGRIGIIVGEAPQPVAPDPEVRPSAWDRLSDETDE